MKSMESMESMEKYSRMFKMYDIRTDYKNLTGEAGTVLISAIAEYYRDSVKVKSVFVGRDARIHCAGLMNRILEIFPEYGLNVFFDPVPISTCRFYYTCMKQNDMGGIMITSSHNPGNYVGFKFVGRNSTPIAMECGPEGGIKKIKSIFLTGPAIPECSERGKVRIMQCQREYVDYSLKLAGIKPGELAGMKIFAEFLSGSAGAEFAEAFEKAGADVALSNPVPDGLFPQGDPNPIIEASIAPSRERMRRGQYDIGFCFDGDGDRMDLMYHDGSQIIPGLNMSLIFPYIRDIFKPYFGEDYSCRLFVDVKAVPLALMEIAAAGAEQHIVRNGHSFIKETLRKHMEDGFVAAEEETAHYYMNFPFDPDDLSKGFAATENSLFFALVTAKAMKENPDGYKRAFELQKGLYRCREWPLYFNVYDEMGNIMRDVEEIFRSCGATVIKNMDDGSDLDAALMRFHLPVHLKPGMKLPEKWCQVAQRISRSEEAMTRWEVVASAPELCDDINNMIRSVADAYVEKGLAHY